MTHSQVHDRAGALLKILLPRAAHRVYKLRVALGVAVARVPGLRVTEGGVYYALVGDEIRVADTQVNYILILCEGLPCRASARCRVLKSFCDAIAFHASVSSFTCGITVEPFGIT